jgi:GntR family transcriptional regulator/MocR family aminotransferase
MIATGRGEFRNVLSQYLKNPRHFVPPGSNYYYNRHKAITFFDSKCLLDQTSEVWLEDPSNDNVKEFFLTIPIKLYLLLLTTRSADQTLPKDKIPHSFYHSFSSIPMGGILPIQRKIGINKLCGKNWLLYL